MLHVVIYLILHIAVCLILFVCVQRPAFFYTNRNLSTDKVTSADFWHTLTVGFKSDVAGTSYLTALPFLVLWVCAYCRMQSLEMPLLIADGVVALCASLIIVADIVLYGYWRFRIDVSVFAYLRSLKAAFASVTVGYLVVALSVVAVFAAAIFALFYLMGMVSGVFTHPVLTYSLGQYLAVTGVFLLSAAVLFAMIRGIKHRPNSPYHLYYSTNMYLNHAAVNPVFNLTYSASIKSKESDKFNIFDDAECTATVKAMLPTDGTPTVSLLSKPRPNVLVIVWESLCSYFTAPLGGKSDVTVNLDRLCDEGILFTRVDAGSWRTDPAMVCILSGYPGQPTTSIMRDTHKLPGLPALPRTLRDNGYSTSLVHGGPLSYMHMIDYYMVSGHDRIVGLNDFGDDAPKCAWGVHDGYMFDWLYDDLMERKASDGPWYTTFLTLSSHQPYIVPYKRLDNEIDNSYAYTDDAFGRFIEKFKKSPMWDDTLIVVLGDHGINVSFLPQPRHAQPHIPLLLLGGAIKGPMKIDTIMSQCDFPATLLGQLGIRHDDFIFSRDVLADTYVDPFSINIYNNGFLYRDRTGYTEFDNVAERAVDSPDPERERRGRMFMQYMMNDLKNR